MDAAIVDLDGTVYRGGTLVPGAADGIEALRAAGLDVLFFSNNPTRDGVAYAERLTDLGIPTEPEEACSAGVATTEYLREHHADDAVLLVGDPGLREQLERADLLLTDEPDEVDVIVASWTATFGYDDMLTALDAADEDTPFLGTDPDRTFPTGNGTLAPGSGAVIGAVAATIGREPDAVLGKPSEFALALALSRLGAEPESCLVVGDRLDTDLAMGERAGMTTVLVRTGVTDDADIPKSRLEPDYVLDSLGEIGRVLEALGSRG